VQDRVEDGVKSSGLIMQPVEKFLLYTA